MTNTTNALAAALLLVIGAGCRGKAQQPLIAAAAKEGKAMVRVMNATPSPLTVRLSGDERTLFSGVQYKDVTPYAEVHDDLIALHVYAAGDKPLAVDHEVLRDGDRYTAVVLPDEKRGTRLRMITDNVVPAEGMARIRVINASTLVKDSAVALLGEAKPLFSGLDFAGTDGYKDVAPSTITLDVRRDANHVTPMILKALHVQAGKAYTIVITGGRGSRLEVFTFEDARGPTTALRGT